MIEDFSREFILSINSTERIASMKLFIRERPNQSMKPTADRCTKRVES